MMSNTVVCSRSRYSLSFLIAIDYGGIYCRTLPKWITVYTRLAKETKRGEQLAAEAEKREELATVDAYMGRGQPWQHVHVERAPHELGWILGQPKSKCTNQGKRRRCLDQPRSGKHGPHEQKRRG
jgi:hypothetical protein